MRKILTIIAITLFATGVARANDDIKASCDFGWQDSHADAGNRCVYNCSDGRTRLTLHEANQCPAAFDVRHDDSVVLR